MSDVVQNEELDAHSPRRCAACGRPDRERRTGPGRRDAVGLELRAADRRLFEDTMGDAATRARLSRLARSVLLFASLDHPTPSATGPVADEFDTLAAEINVLVDEIQASHVQLKVQASERAALANELAEAAAYKVRFLDAISHELRTPLTAILGFAQTRRRLSSSLTTEQSDRLLSRVDDNATLLSALVDDLLMISSINDGRVIAHPTLIHLAPFVHGILSNLGIEEVSVDEVHEDTVAYVDRRHLAQMLTNLLTNAARFGRLPIVIGVTARGAQVVVAVTDAGDGVEPAAVPRMFDSFRQGFRGESLGEDGFGLGLWIVRLLAEANRGAVAYSPASPVGARFEVTLPRASALLAAPPSSAASA